MDDEAAFIETIRLHPNDDTPRLIYADWLEDRGDRRAEYLRLTARIAELERLGEKTTGCDVQLRMLSKGLNADWRGAVGRRYDVVLQSMRRDRIWVIHAIRELTALGLREAKEMTETFPSTIMTGLLREEAASARAMLESGVKRTIDRPASSERICEVALRFAAGYGVEGLPAQL